MAWRDTSHVEAHWGSDAASAAANAFQSLSSAIEAVRETGSSRTSEEMIADAEARKHEFIAALAMLIDSLQELRFAGEYEAGTSIVSECRVCIEHAFSV